MPGKKKKKKKGAGDGKKKGKKGDGEKDGGAQKPYEPPGASIKELGLQKELDVLDLELGSLKKQVMDLREENEWLLKEAEQTKQETNDYQFYLTKKADKRQHLIISLNDYNQQQLREIAEERDQLLRDYHEKKAVLDATLLEKENELAKIKDELEVLKPFSALQEEQEEEIKELELHLEEEKFAHENNTRAIKIQFIKEKRAVEESAEIMIKEVASKIKKQATESMARYTQETRRENQQLRRELQDLIDLTDSLQHQKKMLKRQYQELKDESQYASSLEWLRGPVVRGGQKL